MTRKKENEKIKRGTGKEERKKAELMPTCPDGHVYRLNFYKYIVRCASNTRRTRPWHTVPGFWFSLFTASDRIYYSQTDPIKNETEMKKTRQYLKKKADITDCLSPPAKQ